MPVKPDPVRRGALHHAFRLVEAVQLPDVEQARTAVAAGLADAERHVWPETIATLRSSARCAPTGGPRP